MNTKITFESLGLSQNLLQALEKKGFIAPSPIQQGVIPILLKTKSHIVGQAQTGTGKTAAFGLPILDLITEEALTQTLILTPTRELSVQVTDELNSLKNNKNINIVTIYGGQAITIQLKKLKSKPQIIVGTPGRVIDHLKRKTLDISQIRYLVLDEADEMLSMGFQDDLETIFEYTQSKEPQILLFSATFPRSIKNLVKQYISHYEQVSIPSEQLTTQLTKQIYYSVSYKDKFEALCCIIDLAEEFYGIIFCQTKIEVQNITQLLIENNYKAAEIHGNLSQSQREQTLKKFKSKAINILIATDVAARGIDVQNLTHVINYTLPKDPEVYVHRIGRTGRAGSSGTAIALVSRSEMVCLALIKNKTNSIIEQKQLPTPAERIKIKQNHIVEFCKEKLQHFSSINKEYQELAHHLLGEGDADKIIAILLKYFMKDSLSATQYKDFTEEKNSLNNHSSQGETRLFIAMGKKTGTTIQNIIDLLVERGNLTHNQIQKISILEEFSFASVPKFEADMIIQVEKKMASSRKGKPLISVSKNGDSKGSRNSFSRGSFGGNNKRFSSKPRRYN